MFYQLQLFVIGSAFVSITRTSMIDVDQVLITLTGRVLTFSELEKEVNGLASQEKMGIRNRLK